MGDGERNTLSDYVVKIEYNGQSCGSGVLYTVECSRYAYILTAAHVLPIGEKEFTISISFAADDRGEPVLYHCKVVAPGEKCDKSINRVCCLEGYDPEDDSSPNDGAVIEIACEDWMTGVRFEMQKAGETDRLMGKGYPKILGGLMDRFKCEVVNVPKKQQQPDEGKGVYADYLVKYNPAEYDERVAIDAHALDGFSGMGIFLEDATGNKCVAIFSRDAGESPNCLLTDIFRLEKVVKDMQSEYPIIFPNANFVKYGDFRAIRPARVEADLNIVLDQFLQNTNDYFRCLCGYAGVGKSYAITVMRKYYSQIPFETSWKEMMKCLNHGDDMSEFMNTVFIVDPLEQVWPKQEKQRLYYEEGEEQNVAIQRGRLNTIEKIALLEKIQNLEGEIKANKIHILIVCRSLFWKDVEMELQRRSSRLKKNFMDKIIVCTGYDESKIKNFLNVYDLPYSPFFWKVPLLRHPRWLSYIASQPENLPQREETQFAYEFRLYHSTLQWFLEINIEGRKPEALVEREDEVMFSLVNEYIEHSLDHKKSMPLKWKEDFLSLLWSYPFKEFPDGYDLEDLVLYSYLVARTLFYKLNDGEEESFLKHFMRAYEIGVTNPEIGLRIPVFLKIFMMQSDDEQNERQVKEWLKRSSYNEYRMWLEGNDDGVGNTLIERGKKWNEAAILNAKNDTATYQDNIQQFDKEKTSEEEIQKNEVMQLVRKR